MDCLLRAWHENEQDLKQWLLSRTGDENLADDCLQDVFHKVIRTKEQFCGVEHKRSWLFRIARNTLIDVYRQPQIENASSCLELVSQEEHDLAAVIMQLQPCMHRVLAELNDSNRDIIESCDMNGMRQQDYAESRNLSLPAVKSRLQRARRALRAGMVEKCQIKFDAHGVCCFTPRK